MRCSTKFCRLTPARTMCIPVGVYVLAVILLLARSWALVAQEANSTSADRGRQLFERRCAGCHSLDKEKEGPRLRGVYGRKAGSVSSFTYSEAVKKAAVTWDDISLDQWLTDPDKFIPDSDMAFHLERSDERSDVVAYLKQLSPK